MHAHANEPALSVHVASAAQLCTGAARSVHTPPTIRPPPLQPQHASSAVYTTRYGSYSALAAHQSSPEPMVARYAAQPSPSLSAHTVVATHSSSTVHVTPLPV